MSAWSEKFVIGLTGNIATGKSVVRKMLEHLGAYGIDADALAHRAMARGAPGYKPVVESFGKWVVAEDGQIDRNRLGRIVFSDPDALAHLENIIHPFVRQAIDVIVRRAPQKVIVIEAIKLLEGELHESCDAIWVVEAPKLIQASRLVEKRRMSEKEAMERIEGQNPQEDKIAAADVVINNGGSFEGSWQQVLNAWRDIFPEPEAAPEVEEVEEGVLSVQRAGPGQVDEIAELITRLSDGARTMTRDDVMAAFGEKAYMVLIQGEDLKGLVGWQVENLVTRATDFYLDPDLSLEESARPLIEQVEQASRELQSEAALLFLPRPLARRQEVWQALGYEPRTIDSLGVRAWQDAARESQVDNSVMYFKQLRVDRVLRPI